MIADEWFKKFFEKKLRFLIGKVGHGLELGTKDKIIRNATNFYVFTTTILLFIFIIYLFTTSIYNRIGFEKTVLLLLTIIMLRLKK